MSSVMYVLETDEIRGETYPVFIGGESSHRGRIRNKSAVKFLGNHGGKIKLSFHRGGRLYTIIRGQQNLQVGDIHLHLAPPLSGF